MKNIVKLGFFCIILGLIFLFKDNIFELYNRGATLISKEKVLEKNKYYRDEDFLFVKNTDNFSPTNKQDLYDIYYSVINSGVTNFSFNCNYKYKNCINDVKKIANDRSILSDINDLVHPFNSFKNIETEYNNYGRVTIKITKTYTKKEILELENKVKQIEDELITDENLSDVEKIKLFHDYIISNNIYDSDRSDRNITNYKSDTAYGALFEGYSICGGYSDAMALFLNDLDIKNYKVASNTHVWNALYLNGNWLNLDLTWDDPVNSNGSNTIEYNFFLITTKKLLEIETVQHNFNKNVYKELVS